AGGTFDLNGKTNEFAGLTASAGALSGQQADDTLIFTDDADMSGLTSYGAAGFLQVRAVGSGGKTVTFNAGGKTLNNLCLAPRSTGSGGARIAIAAGSLNVGGNLILRSLKAAAGSEGIVDFTADPAVTVN